MWHKNNTFLYHVGAEIEEGFGSGFVTYDNGSGSGDLKLTPRWIRNNEFRKL